MWCGTAVGHTMAARGGFRGAGPVNKRTYSDRRSRLESQPSGVAEDAKREGYALPGSVTHPGYGGLRCCRRFALVAGSS